MQERGQRAEINRQAAFVSLPPVSVSLVLQFCCSSRSRSWARLSCAPGTIFLAANTLHPSVPCPPVPHLFCVFVFALHHRMPFLMGCNFRSPAPDSITIFKRNSPFSEHRPSDAEKRGEGREVGFCVVIAVFCPLPCSLCSGGSGVPCVLMLPCEPMRPVGGEQRLDFGLQQKNENE